MTVLCESFHKSKQQEQNRMRVFEFLALFLSVTTGGLLYQFYETHHHVSLLVGSLFFFLVLNSLICLWEMALGFYIDEIKTHYEYLKAKYKKRKVGAVIALMTEPLDFGKTFSFQFWSKIWSTYSLYDPSYSNKESFGFFVDVGNGWTTLLPSLLYLVCMIYPVVEAKYVGMIGLVKFYQELYGTVIYALSFLWNKRYLNTTLLEALLFVLFANGLWFFFPLIGIWASVDMIQTNSYDVFYKP